MVDIPENPQGVRLQDALVALTDTPVPVLAGGTDFYAALQDAMAPVHVLDITRIQELRYIRETDDGWTIGAGATWTDVINASLPPLFDALKSAAAEVGSIQIQNAATVAGNLCNASPAADGVPPLLALNASVELASVHGRRVLALSEFILGPRNIALESNELLVAIHIPRMADSARSAFGKLGSRKYLVISIVMVSITIESDGSGLIRDARIAVGACSPVACRLKRLEAALVNQSVSADLMSLVSLSMLAELDPIDDVRGSREYRLEAVQELICRLLLHTLRSLPDYQKPFFGVMQKGVSQ